MQGGWKRLRSKFHSATAEISLNADSAHLTFRTPADHPWYCYNVTRRCCGMFLPTKRSLPVMVLLAGLVFLASAISGEDPFAAKRRRMVEQDIRDRGVH